jgi:Xaa-Pro aminopeptidase
MLDLLSVSRMKRFSTTFLLFLTILTGGFSQEDKITLTERKDYYQYDQDFLPASFHNARRDSLRSLMPSNSAFVVFASPERKRSNDVYYEYHQDPNFYYLSGLREPNAMLIIYKDVKNFGDFSTDEILFMQERNPSSELWNGRRLGVEKATENLSIDFILRNIDFMDFDAKLDSLRAIFFEKPLAFENKNTLTSDNITGLYSAFESKNTVKMKPNQEIGGFMMAQLRQVKTPEEIKLLRKAILITCEAQNQLMREIDLDMTEYQTEAIIEYVFKKNGAEYPGFPSIQGSGENSCILHYTSNRRPLINGGLLVSDVGAEYHGYTADVTRTIPPSGKFTKEQKQIYELVLKAQSAGIEAAQVGMSFWHPGKVATEIISDGLMKLGIIEESYDVKKYFMHGTSHYLGLDVHDAGIYTPLEAGNVITVEPGIYIAEDSECNPKWWNIGVRIEDDILITKDGPENLSISSPRTVNEIEVMMQK